MSSIPYEDLYFSSPVKMTKIALREYINSFDSPEGRPLYLFDGKSLSQIPRLASDYIVPQWLDNSYIYLKQLILGSKGSGTPPHFHNQAVNVLIYGVKEWYFWKPSKAFFAFSHVIDWKNKVISHSLCTCICTSQMIPVCSFCFLISCLIVLFSVSPYYHLYLLTINTVKFCF